MSAEDNESKEVWIEKIEINGKELNLKRLLEKNINTDWVLLYDSIEKGVNDNKSFNINYLDNESIRILFRSHKWSGIVKIDGPVYEKKNSYSEYWKSHIYSYNPNLIFGDYININNCFLLLLNIIFMKIMFNLFFKKLYLTIPIIYTYIIILFIFNTYIYFNCYN